MVTEEFTNHLILSTPGNSLVYLIFILNLEVGRVLSHQIWWPLQVDINTITSQNSVANTGQSRIRLSKSSCRFKMGRT